MGPSNDMTVVNNVKRKSASCLFETKIDKILALRRLIFKKGFLVYMHIKLSEISCFKKLILDIDVQFYKMLRYPQKNCFSHPVYNIMTHHSCK